MVGSLISFFLNSSELNQCYNGPIVNTVTCPNGAGRHAFKHTVKVDVINGDILGIVKGHGSTPVYDSRPLKGIYFR